MLNCIAFLVGLFGFPVIWGAIKLIPRTKNDGYLTNSDYKSLVSFPSEGRSIDEVVENLKNNVPHIEFTLYEK